MSRFSPFIRLNIFIWILFACLISVIAKNFLGLNFEGEVNRKINYEQDTRANSEIELDIAIFPPTEYRVAGTKVSIYDLTYHPEKIGDIAPNELCVKQVRLLENWFENSHGLMGSHFIFNGKYPICFKITPGVETTRDTRAFNNPNIFKITGLVNSEVENDDDIYLPLGEGNFITSRNGFVYPYDNFWFEFALSLTYSVQKDGIEIESKIIVPKITHVSMHNVTDWDVQISDLIENRNSHDYDEIGLGNINQLRTIEIDFSRPLFYRVIYPVVMFTLLLLIISLSFLNSVSDFIEGTLAVLFGMFGLKSFLIPPTITLRTMLDVIVLGLYMALGISLALFLSNKYYFSQKVIPATVKDGKKQIIQDTKANSKNAKSSRKK